MLELEDAWKMVCLYRTSTHDVRSLCKIVDLTVGYPSSKPVVHGLSNACIPYVAHRLSLSVIQACKSRHPVSRNKTLAPRIPANFDPQTKQQYTPSYLYTPMTEFILRVNRSVVAPNIVVQIPNTWHCCICGHQVLTYSPFVALHSIFYPPACYCANRDTDEICHASISDISQTFFFT
jgi:hypothetical protein